MAENTVMQCVSTATVDMLILFDWLDINNYDVLQRHRWPTCIRHAENYEVTLADVHVRQLSYLCSDGLGLVSEWVSEDGGISWAGL